MNCQQFGAVRSYPPEFGRRLPRQLRFEAPAENKIIYTELPQYLRQLRNISELIRRLAHVYAFAEPLGNFGAYKQVSDCSLAACKVKVVLQIPRPHQNISRAYPFF